MTSNKSYRNKTREVCKKLSGIPVRDDGLHLRTESEEWSNTKLALVNAVLDTLIPGCRLVTIKDDQGRYESVYMTILREFEERPRNLRQSLIDLADSLQ